MAGKETSTKIGALLKRFHREKDEPFILSEPLQEDQILIKTEEVKSLELAKIRFFAVIAIIGLFLLFVPLYKPSFGVKSFEDAVEPYVSFFFGTSSQASKKNYDVYLSAEDAEKVEYLFEIKAKETYSYWDEAVYAFGQMFLKQSPINLYDIFTSALGFFWLIIVLLISCIIQGVFEITKSVRNLIYVEKTRMKYAMHIEKDRKQDLIKAHQVYHVLIAAGCILVDRWIPFGGKILERRLGVEHFFSFSNCLLTFWIAIALVIVLFALKFDKEVLDLRIKDEISKRWKQRKNKQDNERARQKKQERQKDMAEIKHENNDTIPKENERKSVLASNVDDHTSSADELVKYKSLLEQGIITQEEFDGKKKQLLGL